MNLEEFYNDIIDKEKRVEYTCYVRNISWVFYKGFKLTKDDNGGIEIEDVRYSEYYTDLKSKDVALIKRLGFIKAADLISNDRNRAKVNEYKEALEELEEEKKLIKSKEMNKADKKRLNIVYRKIDEFKSDLYLHQLRVDNYKNKYK